MSAAEPIKSMDDAPINIAGVLVRCRPEHAESVAEALNKLPGTEVHQIADGGRLIVTVEEAPGEKFLTDTITDMQHLPGVIAASLVYSHSDDGLLPTQEEES